MSWWALFIFFIFYQKSFYSYTGNLESRNTATFVVLTIFSFNLNMQLLLLGQNVCEVNREHSSLSAASSVCDSTKHNGLLTLLIPISAYSYVITLSDLSWKTEICRPEDLREGAFSIRHREAQHKQLKYNSFLEV